MTSCAPPLPPPVHPPTQTLTLYPEHHHPLSYSLTVVDVLSYKKSGMHNMQGPLPLSLPITHVNANMIKYVLQNPTHSVKNMNPSWQMMDQGMISPYHPYYSSSRMLIPSRRHSSKNIPSGLNWDGVFQTLMIMLIGIYGLLPPIMLVVLSRMNSGMLYWHLGNRQRLLPTCTFMMGLLPNVGIVRGNQSVLTYVRMKGGIVLLTLIMIWIMEFQERMLSMRV
mmetsp:Transcript_2460/g.3784  ORF Transcript_2460/g.3784 Transcript_2460/m.3784 type:complete len:223 (+) Transcript_2460:261-929(+)